METKLKKCSGKFNFCSHWFTDFTNGHVQYGDKRKGLGFTKMSNIKTDKPTRNIPLYVYGSKKNDAFALSFCPFCGADYEKLGRLN
jgi:hypothetical protein